MPAACCSVLRMSFAGLAVGVVFVLSRGWRDLRHAGGQVEARRPSASWWPPTCSSTSSPSATRVWPWPSSSRTWRRCTWPSSPRVSLGEPTEGIVYAALGVALAGMVVILVPGLLHHGARTRPSACSAAGAPAWPTPATFAQQVAAPAPGAQHHDRVLRVRGHRRPDPAVRPGADRGQVLVHRPRPAHGGAARPAHHRLLLQLVRARHALHPRAARLDHGLPRAGERPALRAPVPGPAAARCGRSPAGRSSSWPACWWSPGARSRKRSTGDGAGESAHERGSCRATPWSAARS